MKGNKNVGEKDELSMYNAKTYNIKSKILFPNNEVIKILLNENKRR